MERKDEELKIETGLRDAYLEYAMAVITDRALPDVRDGLKPVQRRILQSMLDLGIGPRTAFMKSARIVGHCMGNYHPHGDSAIYESLVRMARWYSYRYPLVKGQGNFGSLDGDPAAAMRYTESRGTKISQELLADINLETVSFKENYDGKGEEPEVLPAKFPNLICNGAIGIAVGMACSIPPHNLSEVVKALKLLIDEPDTTFEKLLEIVKGPDFPTGGEILKTDDFTKGYSGDRGIVVVRGKVDIEQKGNKTRLLIVELPYLVRRDVVKSELNDLKNGELKESISHIIDESDKRGQRIAVYLKKGEDPRVVLNTLYERTSIQTGFSLMFTALVDGKPRILNLKEVLEYYLKHRGTVIRNRTRHLLAKDKARIHDLEGLRIASQHIEEVVKLVRKLKGSDEASKRLQKKYKMTERQASVVLGMRIGQLTRIEKDKIDEEHGFLMKRVDEYEKLLASNTKIAEVVKSELDDLDKQFGDKRRTKVAGEYVKLAKSDFVQSEDVVVTVSNSGYVKRMPIDTYRRQNRGGKGVKGADVKDGDFVKNIFVANTHDYLLLFTKKGMVHWLRVYDIPSMSRNSRGRAFGNLVDFDDGDELASVLSVKKFEGNVVLATKNGVVKRMDLSLLSKPRRGGIKAVGLRNKDIVVGAEVTSGDCSLSLSTSKGMAIRFYEVKLRKIGRTGIGVRGVRLNKGDKVKSLVVLGKDDLMTVTSNGCGKKTPVDRYRPQARGGKGVANVKLLDSCFVVGSSNCSDGDDLILVTKKGKVVRMQAKSVRRTTGRNTSGSRLVRLDKGDSVASFVLVNTQEMAGKELRSK